MSRLEQHEEDCLNELGERFRCVHEWLDELQPEYGPMHRVFRHHLEGVERVRARWGDLAARAAELHIRRDTGGALLSEDDFKHMYGLSADNVEPEND